MRYLLIAATLGGLLASAFGQGTGAGPWTSSEIVNHADFVTALVRYHDLGQYGYEIRQVANSAREYLESLLKEQHPTKLAAVFDIDETALSNWNLMLDCGFCSYQAQLALYPPGNVKCAATRVTYTCDPENLPAIVPVRELYMFAKEHGVAVFFVTGRPENQRDWTEKNLKDQGYPPWDGLYMKPAGSSDTAAEFKPKKREEISKNYRIVLNIGDQASDLAGCCADRVFKLPNPFYLIP